MDSILKKFKSLFGQGEPGYDQRRFSTDPWTALEGHLSPKKDFIELLWCVLVFALMVALFVFFAPAALAGGTSLPGDDASDKLQAAGTLLRLIDTGLFKWGARIFAGICIMSSAWALKEQRFGIAIICILGAMIFGTAPTWVKNIFDIGGNQGLFSFVVPDDRSEQVCASVRNRQGRGGAHA